MVVCDEYKTKREPLSGSAMVIAILSISSISPRTILPPPGMVNAYYKLLRTQKISSKQIKKDYFPGY
jgi:hypothetical protein